MIMQVPKESWMDLGEQTSLGKKQEFLLDNNVFQIEPMVFFPILLLITSK